MQNEINIERAKQFLPFDSLKGFRKALIEKEKEIEGKYTILEDKQAILNKKKIKN